MDGTLTDLHIDWNGYGDGMLEVVAQFDPHFAAEAKRQWGGAANLFNTTIQIHGDEAREVLVQFCRSWEREHFGGHTLNHYLAGFIRKHPTQYEYFLWTSNHLQTAELALSVSGLLPLFEKIITADEVTLVKPKPDGFELIFNPSRHKKRDFLMIGDSDADAGAAEAAGIDFLRV
jgi:phosphoglycolate phosphatase-like HAD superfamily hydrolase